jgi:hypothetical protein
VVKLPFYKASWVNSDLISNHQRTSWVVRNDSCG